MIVPLESDDFCRFCGKELPEKRTWSKIYCTPVCCQRHANAMESAARLKARSNKVCIRCGATFTGQRIDQKYCSQRCAHLVACAAYHARNREKEIAQRRAAAKNLTCRVCGGTFDGFRFDQKYCCKSCQRRAFSRIARKARQARKTAG